MQDDKKNVVHAFDPDLLDGQEKFLSSSEEPVQGAQQNGFTNTEIKIHLSDDLACNGNPAPSSLSIPLREVTQRRHRRSIGWKPTACFCGGKSLHWSISYGQSD